MLSFVNEFLTVSEISSGQESGRTDGQTDGQTDEPITISPRITIRGDNKTKVKQ